MKFIVEGEIDLGKERRKFMKEVDAPNERVARDLAYSLLGSAHGKARTQIKIASVKAGE